ncbi:MAG: carboxylesterase family protein, partial [Oscillospiraceae bacterium]
MELKILIKNGYIEGTAENGARAWKGIPYADKYTGVHRFKEANPCEKWEGVLKTSAFPRPAPQLPKKVCGIEEGVPTGEESLCINIWAPEQTDEKRPVIVWIYGGAFVSGDAGLDLYDGARLASEKNMIVASFNYRINALGFLDFSSVIPEAQSNVGLRDQVLALKWIYENIEAFGGDRENITIFGQSAGGHSVTTLLSIPAARSYIAKAIAMSSYPLSVNTREQAASYAARFLEIMGIEAKDARKLFTVPADELVAAAKKLEDEVSAGTPLAAAPARGTTTAWRFLASRNNCSPDCSRSSFGFATKIWR